MQRCGGSLIPSLCYKDTLERFLEMIVAKHFYMIRHGETEANRARIMAGSVDTPLTKNGKDQARKAAYIVKSLKVKPKTVVHSHLSRARDTANIINAVLDVPLHEDPDFSELHAGDWEGESYDKCRELLVGWGTPPNGESFDDFFERIKRGKNTHLQKHEGPVLIVCHGGVFRAFGKIYGIDTLGVENCHLYEFVPNTENEIFPWTVWQYDQLENGEILRKKALVYHDQDANEMAS